MGRTMKRRLGLKMTSKMFAEWHREPPKEAYEGLPFPCTPEMFRALQISPIVSRDAMSNPKIEGRNTTWGELFPPSILFRFMIGLSNKKRPVLPETNPVNDRQRLFIIKTLFLSSQWRDADRKMIREWMFGDLFTEAMNREIWPSISPVKDKKRDEEIEGMRLIVDMFYGIHQGLTDVSYPVEMGVLNHDTTIEPIEEYRFSFQKVCDALNMMTRKQAYSWTTEA